MKITKWLLPAALAFVAMCGGSASAQIFDCQGCDLGDPFTINPEDSGLDIGGWAQIGWHSQGVLAGPAAPGTADNGTGLFNTYPDKVQAQQLWGYIGKSVDTSGSNPWDVGFRADYVYGTDGPDTQAFGSPASKWDNTFDHGAAYGHAIPQLYGEVAYGDFSVIAGHFFTIVGYEVVQATGNFFYSHAFTQYLAEPFTHTGVLTTYSGIEDVTIWNGWTNGWDTGFADNGGNNYLGGISLQLTEDVALTYTTTIGDFGNQGTGPSDNWGYSHSFVFDWVINDNWEYVLQHDYISNAGFLTGGASSNTVWGINNYLFYTINDCLALGGRFEYFSDPRMSASGADDTHLWGYTFGFNYRPHANVVVRPEIRFHDAVDSNAAFRDQTTVGTDVVITF